jgi:SPX domain protein involved in polyphosphate accumulation
MTSINALITGMASDSQPAAQLTSTEIPDRYELKYLIPERQVDAVRRAIEPFCVLDPHSECAPNHEYAIQSLYLDTAKRDLYRISRERRGRRWKARIRRYEGSDTVFLEVKNKDHDMVKKSRAKVPAAGWVARVHGPLRKDASNAERVFCHKLLRYHLLPTLLVRYMREAWMSTVDSYARVTFDRRVVCQPWSDWSLDADPRNWLALDSRHSMLGVPQGVVLELKCLNSVPRWLSNVIHSAALPKTRYSKYCKGIERLYARDTLLGVLNRT